MAMDFRTFLQKMEQSTGREVVTEVEIQGHDSEAERVGRAVLKDEHNFIHNVAQFYNEEALSDVTIKVGDSCFHAHKFVLAKSSDVFRTMLYDDSWSKGDETNVVLTESTECQAVFDIFLKFMYAAEVTVTVDTAVGILCLADKYNVISLKSLCVRYMVQHSKSPNVHNALSWYNWAKALNLEELIEACSKTIAWNVESIMSSSEWLTMDLQFISDILANSALVVANEYTLYKGLENWLTADNHIESLDTNTEVLLPLIRFPQMLVAQLYSIEQSSLYSNDAIKGQLKELVGKAYRYRSLCPHQDKVDVTFDKDFYKPRNYMDFAVDSVRMQNNLRFGIQVDVRTCVGPVVTDERKGEWKITYRKHENSWTMQLFCHESATVNGEAYIETSVLIMNEQDKVIQVEMIPASSCMRSKSLGISVDIDTPEDSKTMVLLIKPIPH